MKHFAPLTALALTIALPMGAQGADLDDVTMQVVDMESDSTSDVTSRIQLPPTNAEGADAADGAVRERKRTRNTNGAEVTMDHNTETSVSGEAGAGGDVHVDVEHDMEIEGNTQVDHRIDMEHDVDNIAPGEVGVEHDMQMEHLIEHNDGIDQSSEVEAPATPAS